MSVAIERAGRRLLICKGAVEEIFAVSRQGRAGDRTFPLDEDHGKQLRQTVDALNGEGFRVIAVAVRELPPEQASCGLQDERDLTLVGYIAFLDPPKETAGRAIAALAGHGVEIKVLTGDNEIITRKICREVGLKVERLVLGSELESLTPAQLAAVVEEAQVFAKLSPSQKALVINALQRRNHVVGFLGDGINDGPALRTRLRHLSDNVLPVWRIHPRGGGIVPDRLVRGVDHFADGHYSRHQDTPTGLP